MSNIQDMMHRADDERKELEQLRKRVAELEDARQ